MSRDAGWLDLLLVIAAVLVVAGAFDLARWVGLVAAGVVVAGAWVLLDGDGDGD